jgi:pilus assembly protein Flp/PilA
VAARWGQLQRAFLLLTGSAIGYVLERRHQKHFADGAFQKDLIMTRLCVFIQSELMSVRDDLKGVTAMEYGLLAATTVVVGMAAIAGIGTNLGTIFTTINTALTA